MKTQQEVGQFFGFSFDTIKGWARRGMPHAEKHYDLSEIARWLIQDRSRKGSTAVESGTRHARLDRRKLRAEVETIEAANAATQGRLVDRRVVEGQVGQLLIELRKEFERLPARIQASLPRELEGTLLPEFSRLIGRALHEVAQRMQDLSSTKMPQDISAEATAPPSTPDP